MTSLIERAKADAKERDREKRAKEKKRRADARDEIAELLEEAAAFVSKKLETEIPVDRLEHDGVTFPDSDEMEWRLTVDAMKFAVVRKNISAAFSLYLLSDDPEDSGVYIRRLADLVPKGPNGNG